MRSTEEEIEPKITEKMKRLVPALIPSPACLYCRSMKKKCTSFPGNGRCECCHKKGDAMVCLFDDRWPENVSNNKNHPFYSYITRKEEDKSI